MTDYSEQGAIPVEDAAVDDPPTVDEVIERQREEFPEQAATSTLGGRARLAPDDDDVDAALAAGGAVVGQDARGEVEVEGPNSA